MHEWLIDGESYTPILLKTFISAHGLAADFGVRTFSPKDYTGLGRIDDAGAALHGLREAVLQRVPERCPVTNLLSVVDDLGRHFELHLRQMNPVVGLREPEIEFAVAGFRDVLSQFAYALVQARLTHSPPPDFRVSYTDWLMSTLRCFEERHALRLGEGEALVQVVAHAYGRVGLLIRAGEQTYAVVDAALACPAEGFMTVLLGAVAAQMVKALG
jgi:hypothetical protein